MNYIAHRILDETRMGEKEDIAEPVSSGREIVYWSCNVVMYGVERVSGGVWNSAVPDEIRDRD